MPVVMSLEGPRTAPRLLGDVYASMPRRWWRTMTQLQGALSTPWAAGWGFAIGAALFGAWLGGSQKGRRIVATIRGR